MEITVLEFVRQLKRATSNVFEEGSSLLGELPKSYEDVCDVKIIGGFTAVFVPFNENFLDYAHEHDGIFFKDQKELYAPVWFFPRNLEFEIKDFLHNKCYLKLDSDPDDFKSDVKKNNELRQHFIKYPMLNFDVLTEAFKAFETDREFYLTVKKDIIFIRAPLESSFSGEANRFFGVYVSEIGAWAFNYIFFKKELGIAFKQFKNSTEKGVAA